MACDLRGLYVLVLASHCQPPPKPSGVAGGMWENANDIPVGWRLSNKEVVSSTPVEEKPLGGDSESWGFS